MSNRDRIHRCSRRLAAIGVAVAATVATLLVAPPGSASAATTPGTAAPSWTTAPVELPSVPNGYLAGIDCPAGACTAVGYYGDDHGRNRPLAARRVGAASTGWTRQDLPLPDGLAQARSRGVSCAAAASCVAVGEGTDAAGGRHPAAWTWNGSTWTAATVPVSPGVAAAGLAAVDCTAAGSCIAVGDGIASGTRKELAYVLKASHWTARPVPTASGVTSSGLTSVSCPSATTCVAVGRTATAAASTADIVRWNGTVWTRQTPAPLPAGTTAARLVGVSCAAVDTCVAVGSIGTGSAPAVLIEALAGGSWTRETAPAPSTGQLPALAGVTCTSSTTCVAVGTVGRTSYQYSPPYVLRRTGSTWSAEAAGRTETVYSEFLAVACPSASTCTAVGDAAGRPFVENYDGSWAKQLTVAPTGNLGSTLTSVSCTSATACVAVGTYDVTDERRPFAVRWDGTSWTWQDGGRVPSLTHDLTDVSCSSDTGCIAVGRYGWYGRFGFGSDRPLIENEGTSGMAVQGGFKAPQEVGALTGVSCLASSPCIVVGHWDADDGGRHGLSFVLTGHPNGSSWDRQPVPPPPGFEDMDLLSVACVPGGTVCHAIARNPSGARTDMVWNGAVWSKGGDLGPVDDVTCVSATRCVAVGTADTGDVAIEDYDGTTWTPVTAPDPGDVHAYLTDVSCTAGACTAVGSADHAFVARSSGGAWALEAAVTPPGGGSLHGVSCASDAFCVAVGGYGNAGVVEVRQAG